MLIWREQKRGLSVMSKWPENPQLISRRRRPFHLKEKKWIYFVAVIERATRQNLASVKKCRG